jgi:hypothetical protein
MCTVKLNGHLCLCVHAVGKMHGSGIFRSSEGVYTGEFFNNQMHGQGTFTYEDGEVYFGEFFRDQRQGMGTYRFASGDVFEGEYRENERTGHGIMKFKTGHVYEGDFVGNMMTVGTLTTKDGVCCIAVFKNDETLDGTGQLGRYSVQLTLNGKLIADCKFNNGELY